MIEGMHGQCQDVQAMDWLLLSGWHWRPQSTWHRASAVRLTRRALQASRRNEAYADTVLEGASTRFPHWPGLHYVPPKLLVSSCLHSVTSLSSNGRCNARWLRLLSCPHLPQFHFNFHLRQSPQCSRKPQQDQLPCHNVHPPGWNNHSDATTKLEGTAELP